ncbi:GvpL/GvpF family gas vesicle protein [Actinophytocola sp.]|uniref:GvpL/GvpF family gas vesicle protein n=1 Tax=Actinophytocola sp. TaxID=1872138 RepID=UPI002ED271D6
MSTASPSLRGNSTDDLKGTSLLLHGVVRADHPSAGRVVTWQDLAMVVSDWHQPTREDAVAHLEMLGKLVVDGPVVPLRFGTTATDEESVCAEVLAASAPRLRGLLDRLDGLVELHAYLKFDEDEALRMVFDEHTVTWQETGGLDLSTRIRLGEKVAQQLVTWRRTRSDELLAAVSAVAVDEVALPEGDHTEERRAFLLPHKEVEPARAAITALASIAGIGAECVAPLPAYNFLTEPKETSSDSRWGW